MLDDGNTSHNTPFQLVVMSWTGAKDQNGIHQVKMNEISEPQ